MQSGETSSIHIKQITMFNLQSSPQLLFSAERTIASFPGRFLRGRREVSPPPQQTAWEERGEANDRAESRAGVGAAAGRKAHARAN